MYKCRYLLVFLLCFLAACSNEETKTPSYEETKGMVIDILKTDEGKKIILELLQDENFKKELLMQSDFIKQTIEENLLGDKAKDFWMKLFKDQKFVASFSESIKTQTEDVFKKLLENPDFRSSMIELFKDPQMQDEMLELLKSNDFRSHIQELIKTSLEDPKMMESIKKAVSEESKSKENK